MSEARDKVLEGLVQVMKGLANIGSLEEGLFRTIESQIIAEYHMRIAAGEDPGTVAKAFEQNLATLLHISDLYDYVISDRCEEVLLAAEAAGVTFAGGARIVPTFFQLLKITTVSNLRWIGATIVIGLAYLVTRAFHATPVFWFVLGGALFVRARVLAPVAVRNLREPGGRGLRLPPWRLLAGRLALRMGASRWALSLLVASAMTGVSVDADLAEAHYQRGHYEEARNLWLRAMNSELPLELRVVYEMAQREPPPTQQSPKASRNEPRWRPPTDRKRR